MGFCLQLGYGCLQIFGDVDCQPGIGQDFLENLLPRAIILDYKSTDTGWFQEIPSARGSLSLKVAP